MKLVIVQKWPKRIIFFYVQKIKEFPGPYPSSAEFPLLNAKINGETLPEASSHRFDD